MASVDGLLVAANTSLRQALGQLNANVDRGVLLVVDDDGSLVRTVTDGDLRRFLAAGGVLEDPLSSLPDKRPVSGALGIEDDQALGLMRRERIKHLPLVDPRGVPVAVNLLDELETPVYLSPPHLSDQEQSFVEQAFSSNWVAPVGPNVDNFEREIAEYAGVGHAAALSSGTAGIHLALLGLGVGPGDTVFCSSLTFVASANPILYLGATPVFIDAEPQTWCMSVDALERALDQASRDGKLPRAVVVVNLYGQSADYEPILRLCQDHGVAVVEDAAESLGASYRDQASGSLGRVGIFSFNGNKIITTSGGGMLVSNDAELIANARFLATQAKDPAPFYQHSQIGFNYRMSNVLAGIGRGQLKVLDDRVASRRAVFDRYREGLAGLPGVDWMPEAEFGRSNRWLSVCTLDPTIARVTPDAVIEALGRSRIEARRVWQPLHCQPLFDGCRYYPHAALESFSDLAFERGVCLPSGSNMSLSQQDRAIEIVKRTVGS